jgi:hypothetical protein
MFRTRGSSQSKYWASGKLLHKVVLPTRRTPASHTTERDRHALRNRSSQKCLVLTASSIAFDDTKRKADCE